MGAFVGPGNQTARLVGDAARAGCSAAAASLTDDSGAGLNCQTGELPHLKSYFAEAEGLQKSQKDALDLPRLPPIMVWCQVAFVSMSGL
jgi:hypothetical protein